jgi:hypothetical protein
MNASALVGSMVKIGGAVGYVEGTIYTLKGSPLPPPSTLHLHNAEL